MLIKPKEVAVKDADGVEKTFIISRLPAITRREILAKYPLSNAPKIGDYEVSKDAMLKMMAYVCVPVSGEELPLKTQALIDNHVPDGESLIRLELEMLKYNTSFSAKAGARFPPLPAQQGRQFTPVGYKNADSFFAVIISEKLATLSELKTSVDLEEALDLWEIAITNRYNEALAALKDR